MALKFVLVLASILVYATVLNAAAVPDPTPQEPEEPSPPQKHPSMMNTMSPVLLGAATATGRAAIEASAPVTQPPSDTASITKHHVLEPVVLAPAVQPIPVPPIFRRLVRASGPIQVTPVIVGYGRAAFSYPIPRAVMPVYGRFQPPMPSPIKIMKPDGSEMGEQEWITQLADGGEQHLPNVGGTNPQTGLPYSYGPDYAMNYYFSYPHSSQYFF